MEINIYTGSGLRSRVQQSVASVLGYEEIAL